MNWNNIPHPPHPPPPPPPPGAGPHPGSHPPPPPPYGQSPFWDFINSFGPANRVADAGYGVDHTESPHGFTFGPGGFNAWSGPRGFQGTWGGGRGGRRGGRHGHRRCRHCHSSEDEDGSSSSISEDEEMRDAAAGDTKTPDADTPPYEGVTDEKRDSPATMRQEEPETGGGEHPDPPEEAPPSSPGRHRHGGRCGRGRHGHGPWGGRGGRHGSRHGPHGGEPHDRHHHHHRYRGPPGGGPPPPFPFAFPFGGGPRGGPGAGGAFDFNAMMNAFADHPFARGLREYWAEMQQRRQQRRDRATAAGVTTDNNRGQGPNTMEHDDDLDGGLDSGVFVPPVDIFNTANNWTLHVSVPGAKKEDVNVHWDADRSTLVISGLVYRPGDEGFLNTLVSAERRVGLFERRVQLPPPDGVSRDEDGEKEEVDADHITARMEDGILVVVVPKVEKEWTEVKKVDIL